jgi:hypothetical protein
VPDEMEHTVSSSREEVIERTVVESLTARGIIDPSQAHDVAQTIAPLLAEAEKYIDEALDFAGQMSNARRKADATTDRLRAFALRLLRLDDPTDQTGVDDRRTITLDQIIADARAALDDTADHVTSTGGAGDALRWVRPATECRTQYHAHPAHDVPLADGGSVSCPGQGVRLGDPGEAPEG